jgi:two-component system NtrC family response regulator
MSNALCLIGSGRRLDGNRCTTFFAAATTLDVGGPPLWVRARGDRFLLEDPARSGRLRVEGRAVPDSALVDPGTPFGVGSVVFVARPIDAAEREALRADRAAPFIAGPTDNPQMAWLHRRLRILAPMELEILLCGPTGAGKEVYAQAIHRASGRRGPFVAVNCANLSDALFEDCLFGSVRGAFTGSERDRRGLVAEAEGGTLFLDEIGELNDGRQAKLLRFLQERGYRPVGSDKERRSDVRIIAATNRPLDDGELLDDKAPALRRDLLARFGPEAICLPSLRDRMEDFFALCAEHLRRSGAEGVSFSDQAVVALVAHPWPGNVRELVKTLDWSVALARSEGRTEVQLGDLPRNIAGHTAARPAPARASAPAPARRRRPRPSRNELQAALHSTEWDVAAAARLLGRGRELVWRWIRLERLDGARAFEARHRQGVRARASR